ncbi:U11/U12 small nuclear ribonucleoprotein [Salix suchowensis]|nr:U11/U12 small nuclear ribonucleoprotein [Salix suchowensis]
MESSSKGEDEVGGYNSSNVKKAKLQSTLAALLDDPILSDVPKKPTLSDVDTLISLEMGSAMRISVQKLDGTSFGIQSLTVFFLAFNQTLNMRHVELNFLLIWFRCALMNSATVKDLKLAIKKKLTEMEQSKMGHRHISWKKVWANFTLSHHNQKLLDDNSALQDFSIRNNSQVHFVSYVMSKDSQRHSKRRKHRFFHGLNKRA